MSTDFAKLYPGDATFDRSSRVLKAKKIVVVITDFLETTSELTLLDYGSSIGLMTTYFGKKFKKVFGIDVDKKAIQIAKRMRSKNVVFRLSRSERIPFKNGLFDVVVFNQIYEHVSDPKKSFAEILRVLKPGGVCYFGARNKYFIMDGHNPIPFLAVLPRAFANFLLRFLLGKREYDIKLYSLWELKKLVNGFKIHDYTLEVFKNPDKYFVNKSVGFLYPFAKLFYFLIPNYVWLLRKKYK